MLLSANQISKFHNEKNILDEVSFTIEENDKIALIGVNGTGKSTLLNIIANNEDYKGNAIILKNDITISYLPQLPDFTLENDVMTQVKQSIYPDVVEEFEMKSILTKLGMNDFTQILKTMSGGQLKRVALAIALLKPCDLLLLDEPTNHLDNQMIEFLENYLIKWKKALVMVTHDRYFLDSITNQIWEIEQGKIYTYQGNYSTFLEEKARREEHLLNQEKKRNAFLKKEIEWVRAGVQARGTKSKKRLERFYELKDIAKTNLQKEVDLFQLRTRLGKKTITLENVGMQYEKVLFENVNYNFKQNERVGILGNNGCGKSTLLNIIAKQLEPMSGEVSFGETVSLAYFRQDNQDMQEDMKVIDYIKEVSDDLLIEGKHVSAKQMLERFLFDSQIQHSKIVRLSGGEKRRLYLLRTLMQAPNVLLLDEPTNDLDITTLQILEDYLDHFQGIVITVSHDRYFLDRICDAVFMIKDQQLFVHIGGYSSYLASEVEVKNKTGEGATLYQQQKQQQKNNNLYMSSKEKNELEGMESLIEDYELQIAALDEQMNQCVNDFKKVSELASEREKLQHSLEEKSERWLELLDLAEQIQVAKKR